MMATSRKIVHDPANGPYGIISRGSGRLRVCIAPIEPRNEAETRTQIWTGVCALSAQQVRDQAKRGGSRGRARVFIDLLCSAGICPTPEDMNALSDANSVFPSDALLDEEGYWWGHRTNGVVFPLNMSGDIWRWRSNTPESRPVKQIRAARGYRARKAAMYQDVSEVLLDSRSHTLSDDEETYVEWLMADKEEREEMGFPPTLWELADEIGVDVSSLRRWKRRPHIQDEMRRIANEFRTSPDVVHKIEKALYKNASSIGDGVSASHLLKHYHQIDAVTKVEKDSGSTDLVEELNEEEFEQLMARMKVSASG